MAIPEIRMTFDDTNLSTFIKELLSLNERVELVHKRFDAKIFFKCVGSMDVVRDDVLTWLKLRAVGNESKTETIKVSEALEKTEKSESEQSSDAKIKQYLSEKKNKEGK